MGRGHRSDELTRLLVTAAILLGLLLAAPRADAILFSTTIATYPTISDSGGSLTDSAGALTSQ
jgi:hypothetical protein